jgi:hypothetical protein
VETRTNEEEKQQPCEIKSNPFASLLFIFLGSKEKTTTSRLDLVPLFLLLGCGFSISI